jgi:hypothetical protein
MQIFRTFAALSFAAAISAPALAQEPSSLKPIQSQSIDLGTVAGDAYYTVEGAGYHVVATFAPRGENAAPVRFEAVLSPGQSLRFSTPGAVGTVANTVEITRRNNDVVVRKPIS